MKKQTIALNSVTALLRNRWLHAAAGLVPGLALANPAGLDLASGAVTLTQPNANTLHINQSTASAVLNWNSFSIGQDEFVIFNQPSSSAVTLNRVLGGSMSELLGSMQANGRVFLINPAGILVGQGAQIDVNSFIASTQNITDADFLAGNASGRYVFSGASAQSIVNNGNVTAADGGFVVLLGDTVTNTGVIQATKGTVVLASGSAMTLDITGNGLVSYTVDQAALSDAAGVENLGDVLADGGKVVMTADVARSTAKAAVNNSGFVSARSIIEGKNGEIILSGKGGDVVNSGTLDVSGTAASPNAGKVRITSDRNIHLTDTSRIVANGDGLLGRGGNVRVIADDTLLFTRGATIQGRGGLGGGFVELSGHKALRVRGVLDLGQGGHLLLDPDFLTISDSGETGYEGGYATVSEEFIENQLKAGTDVSLVARKQITVENLSDNLLDGVATGENATDAYVGSLFIGIGEITAAEYSGYVAQTGIAAGDGFIRGAGDANYDGIVMHYSDTIRVDGDIDIVGGYIYGDLTLGNLEAGDDVSIVGAEHISVYGLTASGDVEGGNAYVFSAYGDINFLDDVTVTGVGSARFTAYAGDSDGDISLRNVTVTASPADTGYEAFASVDINAGNTVDLGAGYTVSVVGYGGNDGEAAALLQIDAGDINVHGTINVRAFAAHTTSYDNVVEEEGYDSTFTTTQDVGFAEASLTAYDDVRVHADAAVTVQGAGGARLEITGANGMGSDAFVTENEDGFYADGVFIEGDVTAAATAGHYVSTVTYFYNGSAYAGESLDQYAGFAEIEISTGWNPNDGDVRVADGASVSASGYGGDLFDGSDAAVHVELETQQGDVRVDGVLTLNGRSATTVTNNTEGADSSRHEQRSGTVALDIYTYGGDVVLSESSNVTLNAMGQAKAVIGTGIAPVIPVYGDVELNGDFNVVVAAGYGHQTSTSFEGASDSYRNFDLDHVEAGDFTMTVSADDDVRIGGTVNVRTTGDAVIHVSADDLNPSDSYVVTEIIPGVGDGIFVEGGIDVVASAAYEFSSGYTDFYGNDGQFGAGYDADNIRTNSHFSQYRRSEAMLTLDAYSSVYITEDASIALTDFGGNERQKRATLNIFSGGEVTIDGGITLTGNAGTAYDFERTRQEDGSYVNRLRDDSNRGGAGFSISADDRVTIGEYASITLNGAGEADFSIFADSSEGVVDVHGTVVLNSGRGSERDSRVVVSSTGVVLRTEDNDSFNGGTADLTIDAGRVNVTRGLTINAQGEVEVDLVSRNDTDGDDVFLEGLTVNIVSPSTELDTDFEVDGDTTTATVSTYSGYAPVFVTIDAQGSSGDVHIGQGGLDIKAGGYLDLDVSAGSSSGNINIQGPVRLAATDTTFTEDFTSTYSATTDGYIGYLGDLDPVTGIYDDGYLARFTTTSTRVTTSTVGSTVNADFTAASEVVIEGGITATGGDVSVDISGGSDSGSGSGSGSGSSFSISSDVVTVSVAVASVGGPITITSTGQAFTQTVGYESSAGYFDTYVATGDTTRDGYSFYNFSLIDAGGSASLTITASDISVRGAITVTGVDEASVDLDAASSSGNVLVGDRLGDGSEDDVGYNISVIATGGALDVNETHGDLNDGYEVVTHSGSIRVRGGIASLDINATSGSSSGDIFAGDITVQSQLDSRLNLSGSSAEIGDVVVRAQGGSVYDSGFEFRGPSPGVPYGLPAFPFASVNLFVSSAGFDSILVRADGDVDFAASSTSLNVAGDMGLFAGRDLHLSVGGGESGSVEAENITLQAGLAGAREEEGDHAIGDVSINRLDLTARNVLSITATDSIFAGISSGAVTLEGDGVGLSAGYSIDASYATFYVGDGAAPFGADTLLNLALTVFAPEARPDSTSPNFAISAEYVTLQPGTFHMDGYGAGGSSDEIGVGDHLLIRADHLTFGGSGNFDVADDVTVNFQSFTPNGSIGLEQSITGEEFGNTIQDLNLTVVDHLSRFPGNSMEGLPETDAYSTSFVLGSGLNTGDIIVGETVQQPVFTINLMIEEGPPPQPEEEPPQTPVALELGDDNLICVTNGTTQGCTIPPVQTGGLVTTITPIILLSSTPTNAEINIKPDGIDQKDPRKKHVVVKESAEDANDREVQQKTSDGTTLECT